MFFEMHRHDEFSLFDGFGNAKDAAIHAKKLGYPCLAITNHGNIVGVIKHIRECEKQEIKPIVGCEFYFQPKIKLGKDEKKYHLNLYVKNKKGWENLNKLISLSNKETNFYKTGTISFKELKEHSEGLICCSACVAGFIPRLILNKQKELAKKAVKTFKKIFKDDFYLEIQPFDLHGEDSQIGKDNKQVYINKKLIMLGNKYDVKVVPTTDSHFIKKSDYDTYLKMHEIKSTNIGEHYKDRYLRSEKQMEELCERFDIDFDVFEEINNKVECSKEWFVFDLQIPKFRDNPEETKKIMTDFCIKTLKERGKWNKRNKERLKKEIDVISHHGFQDYFMVVQDYVNFAKDNDIAVGPGRGSAGNSIVNYALKITEVDAVFFDNFFGRFLRKNKFKMPDIDVDFCQTRRNEVISYILEKYPGRSAQTLTLGRYKILNLINDLIKVCDCPKEIGEELKRVLPKYCNEVDFTVDDKIMRDQSLRPINDKFDNIVKHFTKMFGKVRYFGTHASSVILSNGDLESEAGLMMASGNIRTSFDLKDIEEIKLTKLDILGLSSATKVKALEKITKTKFNDEMLEDKKMLKKFSEKSGNVFQFESKSAMDIANKIQVNSFEDIVVATCLNRPGPLSLGMHNKYANAKVNPDESLPWFHFTRQTYGMIIYQEQAMRIAREIGGLDWDTTDYIVKADLRNITTEQMEEWKAVFYPNAKKYGLTKTQTDDLFDSLMLYSFNRGHGIGYAMVSAQLMYYKAHFPTEFWYITMKYEHNEKKLSTHQIECARDSVLIFLPHVNGSAEYSLKKVGKGKGEMVIQAGTKGIKNVGEKAAKNIMEEKEQNGKYKSKEDFMDRVNKRIVNARVVTALEEAGALEFDKKIYIKRVKKYNSTLFMKGL